MKRKKKKTKVDKSPYAAFGIVFLILILPVLLLVSQKQQIIKQNAQTAPSLVCGTNLTLNDANDQFLTSQATRTALQSIHVQLIRMPIRSVGAPSAWEVQAMQDIKAMGVTPLIIFKFSQTDPAGAAKQVIQAANNIFGNGIVYYEFGNERDLAGVDQTLYTNNWNQIISQVNSLAPNGKFGGPVNFQTNPTYVAYFVHNANPKPDFISWHEYTCGNTDPQSVCIGHVANWRTHITDTKTAIQANGDTVPLIFITEWNYDPNNPSPDPRATSQFQQQFTQTALQELFNDGVAGATHYVATGHTEYNLVDPSGNITPEGQTFGQICGQLPTIQPQPTTLTPNPTQQASPTPTGVTPTFGCIGGVNCAPSVTPSQQPTSAPTQTPPTITQPQPTTVTTNPSPIPSKNPTANPSPTDPIKSGNNGGNQNLIKQLLQLIKQLLALLLQLLNGGGAHQPHGSGNNN